ncbi:MAG: orotidine-5'-phosphate decarboxylase [Candidatus Acetothermia bacterium]|jgi:orotidine-5'-phosphate decarboxylase|nr:orotidine-5'-phosphate decarboxylase [Candidatus Acetothermia bacterium]
MIIDRLAEAVATRGPVCVGLDPTPDLIPGSLAGLPLPEAVTRFNQEVVEATLDVVACYKVQIAHYEAMGVEGLRCYAETLRHIRGAGGIVIGDVKRGDIGTTSAMYAAAHLSGEFEADFVTLNPYLGFDAVGPFLPYLKDGAKGLFVLVRTSNPSAGDVQDLRCGGRPVYLHVAGLVHRWGEGLRGRSGFSAIGGVVGGTYPDELAEVRAEFPSLFLLVPGYGAQGAKAEEVARAFVGGTGAVVAASRSIIGAHRGKPGARFAEHAREAVLRMREEIARCLA